MEYKPDNWVVIALKGPDPHYRILAGWSGSYLYGSSWKLNSGITEVEEVGDLYYFRGSSGSVYIVHKDSYGLRMNNVHVWEKLKLDHGDMIELLDEQDWGNFNWTK